MVIGRGLIGPRIYVNDVLELLHSSLGPYVESGQSLHAHLKQYFPEYAFTLIDHDYKQGRLWLTDFVPGGCVRGPETRYRNLKEAEQCITDALREVYGIWKQKAPSRDETLLHLLDQPQETKGEEIFKSEFDWVFSVDAIEAELEEMKKRLAAAFARPRKLPLQKHIGFLPEELAKRFDVLVEKNKKRIFPSDEAVARVEKFLKVLYQKVDEAMASKKKS